MYCISILRFSLFTSTGLSLALFVQGRRSARPQSVLDISDLPQAEGIVSYRAPASYWALFAALRCDFVYQREGSHSRCTVFSSGASQGGMVVGGAVVCVRYVCVVEWSLTLPIKPSG